MSFSLIELLAVLGAMGGFVAGLLGVGGGVVMFPLLYYVPSFFGWDALDAKTVAAIVSSQVFFSAVAGGWAHRRSGQVKSAIAIVAGGASALGSLIGAVASKWVSGQFMLVLFGLVTTGAGLAMCLPIAEGVETRGSESAPAIANLPLGICSFVVGLVIGFLGAGNFAFVPLLIFQFKVPTRVAIGSTLMIGVMNSTTGFIGKLATGQIPLLVTSVVVVAAGLSALAGERTHRVVPTALLRKIYATLVGAIALTVWITIARG